MLGDLAPAGEAEADVELAAAARDRVRRALQRPFAVRDHDALRLGQRMERERVARFFAFDFLQRAGPVVAVAAVALAHHRELTGRAAAQADRGLGEAAPVVAFWSQQP